jgi:hypothetical protein
MAAGNYPQRVRDLEPLLVGFEPGELRPARHPSPMPGFAGLRGWVTKHAATHPVLAAGLARSIGDFATAEHLLPAEAENERAALLWQSGRCEEALAAWAAAKTTPAVLFNLGMALLFTGRFGEAKAALTRAAGVLPESSGWGSLCRLYLAVAQIHG